MHPHRDLVLPQASGHDGTLLAAVGAAYRAPRLRHPRVELAMKEQEELPRRHAQRGLLVHAPLRQTLHLHVRSRLDLQGAPLGARGQAAFERALDVARAGVVPLDQVRMIGIDGAEKVGHGAASDGMKPGAQGAGLTHERKRRCGQRGRLGEERLHRRDEGGFGRSHGRYYTAIYPFI
jgi:hypothetical protein